MSFQNPGQSRVVRTKYKVSDFASFERKRDFIIGEATHFLLKQK
jgi:hypothetical protein